MDILQEYKSWIINNKSAWYDMVEDNQGNFQISINSFNASINFYNLEVLTCELRIANQDGDNLFYLHFELKDLDHAKGLFNEMVDSLEKLKDKRRIEALLCCSSGLTTSFFTMQLNEAAELLGMDIHFDADAYTNLYERAVDKDVILLAPQIGYMYNQVKDILKDKIVLQIPGAIFASYDAGATLAMIREELEKNKTKHEVKTSVDNTITTEGEWGCFMVIAVFSTVNGLTASYRVYDECTILEDRSFIKNYWDLTVYEDILDTVLPRFPQIENVYISTPGIVNEGRLSFDYRGIVDVDVVTQFEEKYHRGFNFCNDHNAITMGYYMEHKDENLGNFIFYYQSYLNHGGGAGIILNDELCYGRNHLAGETHYMLRAIHFSDAYHYLARTPEGQAELTAKQMLPLILSYDPDTVAFCNPMVKDVDAVKEIIARYLPERLLPRIIKVDDEIETLYWGAMLIGRAFVK